MIKKKLMVISASVFHVVVIFFVVGLVSAADDVQAEAGTGEMGIGSIAASLAVGLACLASSYAVAKIGSAGIGAVTEKPELMGKILVFLGLAEGIAIYGLIIAIMILNKF